MTKNKIKDVVQKYTMILILLLVVAFFAWRTGGKILMPQNITNIISQNAYVFVLAAGMLLCILTGGNIDLSVGSVVCFVGALGAVWLSNGVNMWLVVLLMLLLGLAIAHGRRSGSPTSMSHRLSQRYPACSSSAVCPTSSCRARPSP